MARASWVGLNEAEVRQRLSRRLGVRLGAGIVVGFGQRSDGATAIGEERWVLIEIEHSQTHPEGNVLKYWPWMERTQRQIVLIHAIAPDARKRRGGRTDLTRWLGAKMQRHLRGRFAYCRIELGTDQEPIQVEEANAAIGRLRGPL